MHTIKRVLSVLLTVLMIVSSLPIAFAADLPAVVYEGVCGAQGDNLTWTLTDNGTLTVSGAGNMMNYNFCNGVISPWTDAILGDLTEKERELIRGYFFPQDASDITDYMLAELLPLVSKLSIGAVVIEEGVTSIGDYAFYSWPATSISLPSTLRQIGAHAFEWCDFTAVDIPDGVTDVLDYAFQSVPLKRLVLPGSVANVAADAFSNNALLQSVVLLSDDLEDFVIPTTDERFVLSNAEDYELLSALRNFLNETPEEHLAASLASYYGCNLSDAERLAAYGYNCWLYSIAKELRLRVDLEPFNRTEVKSAILNCLNEAMGTSFTEAQLFDDGVVYYFPNTSFVEALLACLDNEESEIDFGTLDGFLSNILALSDDSNIQFYLKDLLKSGYSREEAEEEIANSIEFCLSEMNEWFGLNAADLDDLIVSLIDLVEKEQGLSCTKDSIAMRYVLRDFSNDAYLAIAQRFGVNDLYSFEVTGYTSLSFAQNPVPWLTVYGTEGSRIQTVAESAGVPFEVYNGHIHEYQCEVISRPNCTQEGKYQYTCACGEKYFEEIAPYGHVWSVQNEEATCSKAGATTYTCIYCALSYSEVTAPMLPHTPGEIVTENEVAATCQSEGSYELVTYCEACGEAVSRETVAVEKLEHTPAEPVIENLIPSTVNAQGSYDKVVYCTVCGEEISRETIITEKAAHEHEAGEEVTENEIPSTCSEAGSYDRLTYCSICGQLMYSEHVILEKLPHTPGESIVQEQAPTCAEEGYRRVQAYCTVCGQLAIDETEVIEKLPHTYGEMELVNEVAPTCTEDGSIEKRIYCTVCGGIASSEIEVIPAAHNYVASTAVEPTCTETGVLVYTCSVCGDSYSEEIPAKNHPNVKTYVENRTEATQTSEGSYDVVLRCEDCGMEFSRTTKTLSYVLAQGTCGENITWSLTSRGLLTISGTGALEAQPEGEGNPSVMPWTQSVFDYIVEALNLESFNIERFSRYIDSEAIKEATNNGIIAAAMSFYVNSNTSYSELEDDNIYNSDIVFYPEVMQMLRDTVKTIVVEEGITSICEGAFRELWPNVISLPSTLESLGKQAFSASFAQKIIVANENLDFGDGIVVLATNEENYPIMRHKNVDKYFKDVLIAVEQNASLYNIKRASSLVTELFNGIELKHIYKAEWLKKYSDAQSLQIPHKNYVDLDTGLPTGDLFETINRLSKDNYFTDGVETAKEVLIEKIPSFNEKYGLAATTIDELISQALSYINAQFSELDSSYKPYETLEDVYKTYLYTSDIVHMWGGPGMETEKNRSIIGYSLPCNCVIDTDVALTALWILMFNSNISFQYVREAYDTSEMVSEVLDDATLKNVIRFRYIRDNYPYWYQKLYSPLGSPDYVSQLEATVLEKMQAWNSEYAMTATDIDELLEQSLERYNSFAVKWSLDRIDSVDDLYLVNVAVLPEDDYGTYGFASTVNLHSSLILSYLVARVNLYFGSTFPLSRQSMFLGRFPSVAWLLPLEGESEEDPLLVAVPWPTVYGVDGSAAQTAAQRSGLVFRTMTEMDVHTPAKPVRENLMPSTCMTAGSSDIVTYCSVCEREISRETKVRNKLQHTPGVIVRENVVAATETENGSYDEVQYCTVCAAEVARTSKSVPLVLESGTCGENISWNLRSDGTLMVGGTGEIAAQRRSNGGKEETYFPWNDAVASEMGLDYLLTEIETWSGEETDYPMPSDAFLYHLWDLVQVIEIGEGITAIGENAFGALVPQKIVLPQSLVEVEENGLNAMFATAITVKNADFNFEDSGIMIGGYAEEKLPYRSLKSLKQTVAQTSMISSFMIDQFAPVEELINFGVGFYMNKLYSDPVYESVYVSYMVSEWNNMFHQSQSINTLDEMEELILQEFNRRLGTDFINISELFAGDDEVGVMMSDLLCEAVGLSISMERYYEIMNNMTPYAFPLGGEAVGEINEYDESGEMIGTQLVPVTAFPWLTIYGPEDSTAQNVAEAYGLTFERTDAAPFAQTQKTDAETGITLSFSENSYAGTVILIVEETQPDETLFSAYANVSSWDISTLIDGEETQPDAPVMVSIPLPDGYDENSIAVYHIEENGAAVRISDITVENGYIRFFADSFSVYVVVDESSSVAEPTHTPGDINGDGNVNNKDLNRLMKHIAGDEVDVVEAALDVNGDSNVNNKDLNRLMKYLAGEDVEVF